MNSAVAFRNTTAVAARKLENTGADFDTGCNAAAANCGMGVASDNPGLDESLPSWTLLDQFGAGRDPQVNQVIGGSGLGAGVPGNGSGDGQFMVFVTNDDDGLGDVTVTDTCSLKALATGWEPTAAP